MNSSTASNSITSTPITSTVITSSSSVTSQNSSALHTNYINGEWQAGHGQIFSKHNPYSDELIWQGYASVQADIDAAVSAAKQAGKHWALCSMAERLNVINAFAAQLAEHKTTLAEVISQETGKPLWETLTEVQTMIAKVAISVEAYSVRTGEKSQQLADATASLMHRPHGVFAVFGPYNFPGHLPNGHIIPALIAGNTVVFKPSELTPWTAELTLKLWQQAGLPNGVINLVQGARETGETLVNHPHINGILFTGSAATGAAIHRQLAGQVDKMLALEMGGNNALIVEDYTDLDAAVHIIVQSAFISAGQRCTCARRLLVKEGQPGDQLIARLLEVVQNIARGAWNDQPQPFMGTVISPQAATNLLRVQEQLIGLGAKSLLTMQQDTRSKSLLSPGILEATGINLPDEEYFGPLLTLYRYTDFEQALTLANQTRFGLSLGLISADAEKFQILKATGRAGIINWNKPLTGASSAAPFGGIGASGNHRPSAYYAADYAAWPVASFSSESLQLPETLSPGLVFK